MVTKLELLKANFNGFLSEDLMPSELEALGEKCMNQFVSQLKDALRVPEGYECLLKPEFPELYLLRFMAYRYRNICSYGSDGKSSELFKGSMRIRFAIADVSGSETNTDQQ